MQLRLVSPPMKTPERGPQAAFTAPRAVSGLHHLSPPEKQPAEAKEARAAMEKRVVKNFMVMRVCLDSTNECC